MNGYSSNKPYGKSFHKFHPHCWTCASLYWTHPQNHLHPVAAPLLLQCRGNLDPAPIVIIASSDSDMQQLLDDNTYWLELTQVCWYTPAVLAHVALLVLAFISSCG